MKLFEYNHNDFIITNGTTCYFIDDRTFYIRTGIVTGYNNINHTVQIKVKTGPNVYGSVIRNRKYVWFDIVKCLLWLDYYLKDRGNLQMYVMDLTSQLDGSKNILELENSIGIDYTIYLNGLRQNRYDYIVDNDNLTLTINIDPIPNQDDILTIEYWGDLDIPTE